MGFANFATVTLSSSDNDEFADVLPEYLLHIASFEVNPSHSVVSNTAMANDKLRKPFKP
jgi:hypothetical protein